MLGDSKHYVRPAKGERGLNRWQERMRLRRRKSVDTSGMPTHQQSAIMDPTSSQESIELFSVPTTKGGYQQVNLMDDRDEELTSGVGLTDQETGGRVSESEKREK